MLCGLGLAAGHFGEGSSLTSAVSACYPRAFFENFGTVLEAFVSYDRHTGRPRGFGFVVFEDPAVADKVVTLQHTIDRREVRKPYHSSCTCASPWRMLRVQGATCVSWGAEPAAPGIAETDLRKRAPGLALLGFFAGKEVLGNASG